MALQPPSNLLNREHQTDEFKMNTSQLLIDEGSRPSVKHPYRLPHKSRQSITDYWSVYKIVNMVASHKYRRHTES